MSTLQRVAPWALAGLFGALALGFLAMLASEPVLAVDQPLPAALPLASLDGQPIAKADLVGRPWVILVWLPG